MSDRFPGANAHKNQPTVWGLTDGRAGNTSQVRGVVERLGYPHEFKQIHYTPAVHLPNIVRGKTLRGIGIEKSAPLCPPWPDVVVSAGRRLAPAALYIKRHHPQTLVVHMMSPGMAPREFDLLALPSHDRVINRPNVIRTIGAPHHVTPEKLASATSAHESMFAPYPGFRIGMLVGGHTSRGRMREEDMRRLLEHLQRIAGLASLLVTTSRRTPEFAVSMIESALQNRPHYLYRYGKTPGENPYLGILGSADLLVVTGESISMCSEACSTGKPVYVFTPARTLSEKHRRFLAMLFEQGFARPLEEYDPSWHPTNRLDEAGRLAGIIENALQDRQGLSIK